MYKRQLTVYGQWLTFLAYHKAVTKGQRAEDFPGYNEHTRPIKEKENQKKSPGLSLPADLLVT